MSYGLVSQTSINLYEMGFNNRTVSMEIAEILDSEYEAGSRQEIINLIRMNDTVDENIDSILKKYPSYFYEKFMEIH